ncbi:hypothetical protein F7725_009688 [Dissostichus mawsoni]|uniref:Hermes trasposase DNA-binding domain-containing protein n=1 Tax=Dissostichus mawsoni TaxID=36200 RepID=A0A7J5XLP2_DISMA|nr:hypothetical protein F7725_009688 [Dissostichus mawsoni]
MNYHLKHAHPLYIDRATPSTSTSSSQPPLKLSQTTLVLKPPLSDKTKRDITDKIADFVALDMRPVNIVEGEGFKQMMKFIEPGYTVPKRDTRVAVVHDNAANMVLCAQQLSQNPSWGNVQGIRCAGHTLQLCINAAVKLDPICRAHDHPHRAALTRCNASLSATLPMLVNMKRCHLLSRDDDSTTVKAVKKKITEEIDKRWELTGSLEGSIYIQAAVLDPRFKSLSFLDAKKRDDAYATVSDLAESLSPAEEATVQREDRSGGEESEPAPKRQREKQQDISMLMAFDEDQETEDHKKEMKTYLEDRTKECIRSCVLVFSAFCGLCLPPMSRCRPVELSVLDMVCGL